MGCSAAPIKYKLTSRCNHSRNPTTPMKPHLLKSVQPFGLKQQSKELTIIYVQNITLLRSWKKILFIFDVQIIILQEVIVLAWAFGFSLDSSGFN